MLNLICQFDCSKWETGALSKMAGNSQTGGNHTRRWDGIRRQKQMGEIKTLFGRNPDGLQDYLSQITSKCVHFLHLSTY